MKLHNNTILITGGSAGIGLEWTKRLLASNTLIITGRNAEKLADAKANFPELHTYVNDISKESERITLFEKITSEHPEINVLINNAGVMRFPSYHQPEPWTITESEILTNFSAPVHLNTLFAKYFSEYSRESTIINVTSALAHVPLAHSAVYSATKAALHSYTISLRHQLKDQPIEIIELAPPQVHTDLGAPGLNEAGMPLNMFIDEVMEALERGEQEIVPGIAKQIAHASRAEKEQFFAQINS
ncbi:SDR family oxidoreductase [Paenibacillus sp. WLX1005]|uniref:SDR family oxidoreductase n=1 Tax=Paenibacillus sp. WLX1005 TaxID=3243766 RepID=UPI0039843E53